MKEYNKEFFPFIHSFTFVHLLHIFEMLAYEMQNNPFIIIYKLINRLSHIVVAKVTSLGIFFVSLESQVASFGVVSIDLVDCLRGFFFLGDSRGLFFGFYRPC